MFSPLLSRWKRPDEKPDESCLHKKCSLCHGTGVKTDGRPCVHMISCPCANCTPRSVSVPHHKLE